MRTLIIGGGKVGSNLGRALQADGHAVTVIEIDKNRAQLLGDRSQLLVIHGDGTDVDVLTEADAARSDWVLAVTGKDEANLVACQLAKTLGASRVLARLNDPKNLPTFEALLLPVVAVTDLIVKVISSEVKLEQSEFERLTLLGRGDLSLVEVDIPDGAEVRQIVETKLPPRTVLVTLVRGDEVSVPTATAELRPGDRVYAVTSVDNESALRSELVGKLGPRRRVE